MSHVLCHLPALVQSFPLSPLVRNLPETLRAVLLFLDKRNCFLWDKQSELTVLWCQGQVLSELSLGEDFLPFAPKPQTLNQALL